MPQDKNFSSWGVSFLGQKRAVGKRGGISAKLYFKRCLVLWVFDAYQMRKKIFFLSGLPFTPPYLRIYEGIFASRFSAGGDGHKHHLKNISVGGLTLGGAKVRICEKTFPRQKLISKLPLR